MEYDISENVVENECRENQFKQGLNVSVSYESDFLMFQYPLIIVARNGAWTAYILRKREVDFQ